VTGTKKKSLQTNSVELRLENPLLPPNNLSYDKLSKVNHVYDMDHKNWNMCPYDWFYRSKTKVVPSLHHSKAWTYVRTIFVDMIMSCAFGSLFHEFQDARTCENIFCLNHLELIHLIMSSMNLECFPLFIPHVGFFEIREISDGPFYLVGWTFLRSIFLHKLHWSYS